MKKGISNHVFPELVTFNLYSFVPEDNATKFASKFYDSFKHVAYDCRPCIVFFLFKLFLQCVRKYLVYLNLVAPLYYY